MMQRKVTKGRDELAAKLTGVSGGKVVLVFDGKKGEAESSYGADPEVNTRNTHSANAPSSTLWPYRADPHPSSQRLGHRRQLRTLEPTVPRCRLSSHAAATRRASKG